MDANNLFSEDWAIVGVVDPDANTAAAYNTANIDMADWEQLAVILMVGDLGASASVTAALYDSSASPHAAISGKTVTVGGTSPNTGSNTQQVIHFRSAEGNSNARYVTARLTVATATSDCALIVLGKGRHRPAYDNDAASVGGITN